MAPPDLTGIIVLVVDDRDEAVKLFAEILERAGALVYRATSLLEAMNTLTRAHIHIVLTDLAMPGGTGWNLLGEIRERSGLMPVVAVTGELVPGTGWLIGRGFDAVVYKPVDATELVELVSTLVGSPPT